MEKKEIKLGSIVRVKSYGPKMTVMNFHYWKIIDSDPEKCVTTRFAECGWFLGNEKDGWGNYCTGNFSVDSLDLVAP